MSVDTILFIPFEPLPASLLDPHYRQSEGAYLALPLTTATLELESYIGRPLNFWTETEKPIFGGKPMPYPRHRSLTAVALATGLEEAGLSWRMFDPGITGLSYWRRELKRLANNPPKTIALSTTYVMTGAWLRAMCTIIREALPDVPLIAGGYHYATDTKSFLDLDADVFCVGEGEVRFPQIVQRLINKESLNDIPGLYIRDNLDRLKHTGHALALAFDQLRRPDWRLAPRIEPPVDPETDEIEACVETQRGCLFKCEFCTYRILATPSGQSSAAAAETIMATAFMGRAHLNLIDSTATYPHQRWEEVLTHLIERGGAPHPVWAFARVTDITPERAQLMARAGIRQVYIGQESGAQSILNLMKKGTKVTHIKPAIQALREAGIGATISFIHGFPGETKETMAATREAIIGLNDNTWTDPTVFTYSLYPFVCQDFSSVARRPELAGTEHYLAYDGADVTPREAVEEVLTTFMAVSRQPRTPVFALMFGSGIPSTGVSILCSPHRQELFTWLKAVERGVTIFLERNLEGKRDAMGELPRIKREVLSRFPAISTWARASSRIRTAIASRYVHRLKREWEDEPAKGCGLLTKLSAGLSLGMQTRSWRFGTHVFQTGTVFTGTNHVQAKLAAPGAQDFAEDLIANSVFPQRKSS